ncbi:glycosyltransferase [Halostagnicola sp. A-GB9-2]|uniref:glycosyltransferase n=1 Tax=Halostagnicola sp. A-GB9-2 TaxID=3048066 RepID=UPI0024BFE4FC|nr:glycosyltransferase [Halostagnicola sp. A-GB9-2]MDJ1431955.1 glycosyltransferase [Halostagnicola sp. A-GB9-2]
MSKAELVTVVVPTYDRPKLLRRAVQTVAEQTYDRIELVIVDDCSPVPASDVLSEFDPSLEAVTIVRHDANRGANVARNTGLHKARGEYVAFLDDDDCWDERKIEKQANAFGRAPESVGVVYTGVEHVDENMQTNAVLTPQVEGAVTKRLLYGNFLETFSVAMIERELCERVGGLDERFPSWQDWEFFLRLSLWCRFLAVPEPLVVRHNRPNGQLSHDYDRKTEVTAPLFREVVRPIAAELDDIDWTTVDASLEYHLGRAAMRNGRYSAARRHFGRAIRQHPLEVPYYVYLVAAFGGKRTHRPIQRIKRRLVRYGQ